MRDKQSRAKASTKRFSNSYWQSLTGFTLVELLVSVAIITIISAFGIASFVGANRNATVKAQAQELKTQIRKLRTDSGAALKPTNCSSNNGIVYGTYINFVQNDTKVTYGISCFNSANVSFSSQNTLNLKAGLRQGNATYANLTVFFGFDGEVKFFSGISTPPTKAQIDGSSLSGVNYLPIIVTDGSTIGSGNRRQVSLNLNGLVCDEVVNASPSCAQ